MTVITKLSDRENLLSKAILLITVNLGNMDRKRLQWELFDRGIYVDQALLNQCISVMIENKQLRKADAPEVTKVIQDVS